MSETRFSRVEVDIEGMRLDAALPLLFPDLTRSRAHNLIQSGNVRVENKQVKSSLKLKTGDRISVEIPLAQPTETIAQDIPFKIVYQDQDIAVIDKPKGLVVHPAPGNAQGTLVNGLLFHLDGLSGIGGTVRPGIVHRLDKDTSGLMVVAKNDAAHRQLTKQIASRQMERIYVALVEGNIREDTGEVDAPIGRHPIDRKRMAVVTGGREAKTYYKVLARFNEVTLVEAKLATGRTHQIRVHMRHIGHPVCGDPVYGIKDRTRGLASQALHAKQLTFNHPTTGERISFNSDMPDEMQVLLIKFRKKYTGN